MDQGNPDRSDQRKSVNYVRGRKRKVGTIAAEVGKTPQGWNASIFSMIQTLSENVIVPIAGLVITYVLCVELISMVTEKNNMHDDVC